MCTLARDFGSEFPGGLAEWREAHLRIWLASYSHHPEQDEADIRLAAASDPELQEWADWSQMRDKGRWLRRKAENAR